MFSYHLFLGRIFPGSFFQWSWFYKLRHRSRFIYPLSNFIYYFFGFMILSSINLCCFEKLLPAYPVKFPGFVYNRTASVKTAVNILFSAAGWREVIPMFSIIFNEWRTKKTLNQLQYLFRSAADKQRFITPLGECLPIVTS